MSELDRRPLKTRSKPWVSQLNLFLLRMHFTPDHITAIGVLFAIMAGICFILTRIFSPVFFLFAAIFIQLRLLCNMMDGMLAVEGNLKTELGGLFNEIPDRYEDLIILVCAGFAANNSSLGWAAATFAVLTAYLRASGASLGTKQYFNGPMAKPHRMFTITISAILELIFHNGLMVVIGLYIVLFGSVFTCMRRTSLIIKELKAR